MKILTSLALMLAITANGIFNIGDWGGIIAVILANILLWMPGD